jgi:hypothetical protein
MRTDLRKTRDKVLPSNAEGLAVPPQWEADSWHIACAAKAWIYRVIGREVANRSSGGLAVRSEASTSRSPGSGRSHFCAKKQQKTKKSFAAKVRKWRQTGRRLSTSRDLTPYPYPTLNQGFEYLHTPGGEGHPEAIITHLLTHQANLCMVAPGHRVLFRKRSARTRVAVTCGQPRSVRRGVSGQRKARHDP